MAQIAAGTMHSLAVAQSGKAYAWGLLHVASESPQGLSTEGGATAGGVELPGLNRTHRLPPHHFRLYLSMHSLQREQRLPSTSGTKGTTAVLHCCSALPGTPIPLCMRTKSPPRRATLVPRPRAY